MESLDVTNSYGEKLSGILHRCGSKKLVIVCHGRLANKDKFFYKELCENLCPNGLDSFRFDFSGNGESEGKFEESTISKDIDDIKSVVEHFKKIGYEIECLIGHSQGAVEVLLAQAEHNFAKYVVDIAGVCDQEKQTVKKYSSDQIQQLEDKGFFVVENEGVKFNISKKYFYDRAGHKDIREKVSKISVPTLVVHGTNDEDISFDNGKKMRDAIKTSTFLPIEGAGHFFENHTVELISSIVDWIKKV